MIQIETIPVGALRANCYIVTSGDECMLIDPGANADVILEKLHGRKPRYLLVTHCHFDHIAALEAIANEFPEAPICIHEFDADGLTNAHDNGSDKYRHSFVAPAADVRFIDGDTFELGEDTFTVMHTPGHSTGSCCYYWAGYEDAEKVQDPILFSGDTLFKHTFGRTDFERGDAKAMVASLTRLAQLPLQTQVYPGHEAPTSIQAEISFGTINPYDKD